MSNVYPDINRKPLKKRLEELGIRLPAVAGPFGNYIPAKVMGNQVFVAGQLPMMDGTLMVTGSIPSRASVDEVKGAARQCVVNALAAVATLGNEVFDRLSGVLRVGAFVNSDVGFTQQPDVANGASELLVSIFGEEGRHVRVAVGVNTLPLDSAIEIDFIFTLRDPVHVMG